MQACSASLQRRVSGSAGAAFYKAPSSWTVARPSRRPCKPVCFKENTSADRIDGPTRTPSTTTPGGASAPLYGGEPSASTTSALRAVHLGPVATMVLPALAIGTVAASLAAMLAPGAVGAAIFRGAVLTATQKLLLFAAGAALIPSFVSKRRIQVAAENNILAAPVFKQMVSACLLHGVLGLVVLSQAVSLRNPVLAATVGGLTGLATLATSYTLMKIRESGQLVPSARGMLGAVMSVLTPANTTAAAYSVLTVATAGLGVVLFTTDPTTPCFMFMEAKDAVFTFATRMTGAALLSNAVLLFTVKEAADDGRQGSPVFRDINGGMAAYSALTSGAIAYALAAGLAKSVPASWAYLAITAATALLTAFNWYTAPV